MQQRQEVRGRRTPEETRSRAEPRRPSPISASEAAQAGLDQVADLTGHDAEGVVSLEPDDGGWVVGVEVVENRRIPSSTDLLALYEAELDEDGNLVGYARKRRYARSGTDNGG
jgi:hypothetical protein